MACDGSRAGGQAVGVRSSRAEEAREMTRRCPGFLLGFMDRVKLAQPLVGEHPGVDLALAGRVPDQLDESREVLLPFARAEVDAEPGPVEVLGRSRGRSGRSPSGRPRWRTWCSGSTLASVRRLRCSRRAKLLASAAIRVGKVSASKSVILPTPLRSFLERGPGRLQITAQGRDHPHTCHDNSTRRACSSTAKPLRQFSSRPNCHGRPGRPPGRAG